MPMRQEVGEINQTCKGCQAAVKKALQQGTPLTSIKTSDGHIEGCYENEEYWPWQQPQATGQKPSKKHSAEQDAPAPQQKEDVAPIQRFKRVDAATRGEEIDQKRGVWFVVFWICFLLTAAVLPWTIPFWVGALVAIFLVRK